GARRPVARARAVRLRDEGRRATRSRRSSPRASPTPPASAASSLSPVGAQDTAPRDGARTPSRPGPSTGGHRPAPPLVMSNEHDSRGEAVPLHRAQVSSQRKTYALKQRLSRSMSGSERERRATVVEDLGLSDGDVGWPHASGHVA